MFARLRRVPARLSARPGHMHSEGRIICRASRHLIRRVVSFDRPIHPSSGCSFLPLGTFLFCIRDFHVRCSRTHPPSWERTASECIIHLRSLFVSPPHPFPPVFNSCAFLSFLICLRGFGWRIHCGVEVTVLSTNKQLSLSLPMCYLFGGLLVNCHSFSSSRTIGLILTSATSCDKNWRT
jgi:hypothetical protein